MNNQRLFLLKHTIFILLLGTCFFYSFEKSGFRRNGFFISGLTQQESKDIQSTFYESDEDSSLPSTPNDLLNILQRIEAINKGTEPYDAIEDALKAFESEDKEESGLDSDIPINN